jgi:hypothetical protein
MFHIPSGCCTLFLPVATHHLNFGTFLYFTERAIRDFNLPQHNLTETLLCALTVGKLKATRLKCDEIAETCVTIS